MKKLNSFEIPFLIAK